ncbi:MAG: alpha/beta fold hydrolase [Saprospiraceae bacterium]
MGVNNKNTVLIHGFGFDHRTWYPLELAFEGHEVTYLALPGFGMDQQIEPYTIPELAKKYWDHLSEAGVDQVHLVGHSMGGYVCIEMMASQPSRVLSLALIHSHVFADSPEKKISRTETADHIRANGASGFVNKFIPSLFADAKKSEGVIKQLIERTLQYDSLAWVYGLLAMRDRLDHSEHLTAAQFPVLLLMGEADKAVPVDLASKQALLAGTTSLHVYPDTGHMGMYENTQTLIADLVRFYEAFSE